MALNEVFKDANHISLPVPNGTKAGDPVRVGILNGVAETDAGEQTQVVNGITQQTGGIGNKAGFTSVNLKGGWNLTVSGQLTVGQAVFIKSDNTLTATATGNYLFGVALRAKGTGSGEVLVKILQPGQIAASA